MLGVKRNASKRLQLSMPDKALATSDLCSSRRGTVVDRSVIFALLSLFGLCPAPRKGVHHARPYYTLPVFVSRAFYGGRFVFDNIHRAAAIAPHKSLAEGELHRADDMRLRQRRAASLARLAERVPATYPQELPARTLYHRIDLHVRPLIIRCVAFTSRAIVSLSCPGVPARPTVCSFSKV